MDDDPPPPSYEAARAAGAAPPSAPTATTEYHSTNQENSSNSTNNAYHNPNTNTASSSRADGEAIDMQPLSEPPMNPTGSKKTTMVVPLHLMGDEPEWVDCPFCKKRSKTRVVREGRKRQCLAGTALCLACCPLLALPYCLHWFERREWFCSSCNSQIAVRIQDGELKLLPVTAEPTQVPSRYAAATTTPPPAQSQPSSPVMQGPGVVIPEVRVQPPTAVQTPATLRGAEFESSTTQTTVTANPSAPAPTPSQEPSITSEGDDPPGARPLKF